MNNPFGSVTPFQSFAQPQAPTAQVQPAAVATSQAPAPAPMLSQVMPAPTGQAQFQAPAAPQGMPGYDPLSMFGQAKIKSNKNKDYLHQGLYLLQVEKAIMKMCDGVLRWILNGTVIVAVDSVSHVDGGTWGWAPAMDKYGIDEIWTCVVALTLGLHPIKDADKIQTITAEQQKQIVGATIGVKPDGRPALEGMLLAARCVDGVNPKSGKAYTDNTWRPVRPEHGQAAQSAGGWTPDIVRQIAMG